MVGASLWAAQRITANASSCFAVPRYTDNDRCNANSASDALYNWMKANFRDGIVVHGFRHAMRDRPRAVSCPSEMIDQRLEDGLLERLEKALEKDNGFLKRRMPF